MSTKQVIVMRTDLNMRKGKMAAQAAHASLGVFTQNMDVTGKTMNGDHIGCFRLNADALEWFRESFTKICVGCGSEEEVLMLEILAKSMNIPHKVIVDNGATEFNGVPTVTCIAIGPAKSEDIDRITGSFKLL